MSEIQNRLYRTLVDAAGRLRAAGMPDDVACQLEVLAGQVYQPCVVAIVGRVKAGKSTFINALLEQDLAKVGVTETTATINYFRYGQLNPARPVRCHWRGGNYTDVDRSFLDSLQGNDAATLQRASNIDHLEYYLLKPFLQQVTLVDTPGTGAAVPEHQERTADFLQLDRSLRERHDRDTQEKAREADAVIYLIGRAVASVSDREFVDEFQQVTGGQARPLNAIGVMAKIDLDPAVMERRYELAHNVARQLASGLNDVIPVSAGLRRTLDTLLSGDGAGLRLMIERMRRVAPARLEKLLSGEAMYLRLAESPECPLSLAERQELLGALDWTVFTTIARAAAIPELSDHEVAGRIADMSGFKHVREVLERRFFARGEFLRCYRIATDARALLRAFVRERLREREARDGAQLERFLALVRTARGDPGVADELVAFLEARLGVRPELRPTLKAIERAFDVLHAELGEYNADYEALQQLEEHQDLFNAGERDELRTLFGARGLDTAERLPASCVTTDYVGDRQQFWRGVADAGRDRERQEVAERAVVRYGLILTGLLGAK